MPHLGILANANGKHARTIETDSLAASLQLGHLGQIFEQKGLLRWQSTRTDCLGWRPNSSRKCDYDPIPLARDPQHFHSVVLRVPQLLVWHLR